MTFGRMTQLTPFLLQEKLVKAMQEEQEQGGAPRNLLLVGDTLGEEQVMNPSNFNRLGCRV